MNETAKRILKTAGIILLAVILILVIYLLYLVISYHRIEDNLALQVETSDEGGQQETKKLTTGEQYSALTYNIGFGAYTPDFSFFMDGGKSSWAKSKDCVLDTVQGAGDLAASLNPDFAMIEEIDLDSTRSYHVNEYDILRNCFPNDYYVFAQNYDSAFLFYPFTQPHGSSKSGIGLFSKYPVTSALRRSLPIGIQRKINKFQYQIAAEVCNGGDILKYFLQTFVQKPLIAVLLHLNQVRHFQNFVDFGITDSGCVARTERTNSVFFHLVTSRNLNCTDKIAAVKRSKETVSSLHFFFYP